MCTKICESGYLLSSASSTSCSQSLKWILEAPVCCWLILEIVVVVVAVKRRGKFLHRKSFVLVHLSRKQLKYRIPSKSSSRKYQKKWEKDFTWLEYDADCDGAFCKLYKTSGKSLERTGGVWTTKPFSNWKKAVEKMKAHAKSDAHIRASQAS